jgi:hypothetical protein
MSSSGFCKNDSVTTDLSLFMDLSLSFLSWRESAFPALPFSLPALRNWLPSLLQRLAVIRLASVLAFVNYGKNLLCRNRNVCVCAQVCVCTLHAFFLKLFIFFHLHNNFLKYFQALCSSGIWNNEPRSPFPVYISSVCIHPFPVQLWWFMYA